MVLLMALIVFHQMTPSRHKGHYKMSHFKTTFLYSFYMVYYVVLLRYGNVKSVCLSVCPSVRELSREPLNFFQKSLWIIMEGPKTEAKFVNGQNRLGPSGSF